MADLCSIPDCERPRYCRGWCKMHYTRWQRHGDPTLAKYRRSPMRVSAPDRFAFFTEKWGECWYFTGYLDEGGYGNFSLNGKTVKAHRYAFFLANGYWPVPDALHSCDVPHCVNPAHLREGTPKENTRDMIERGRIVPSPGSRNGAAKLTEHDVRSIRREAGARAKDLADQYSVSESLIYMIRRGARWGHV